MPQSINLGTDGSAPDTKLGQSIRATLAQLKLHNVSFVADKGDAQQLAQSPCNRYTADEALALAIIAFLHDDHGSPGSYGDSPLGLILTAPEQHGLPPDVKKSVASTKLREYLTGDPQATIALLTPQIVAQARFRFTPEYGESLAENWVFRFLLPTTLDVLIWVVVDKTGGRPPYSYCIE